MNHDIEAAFASSELADILDKNQQTRFKIFKRPGKWILTAGSSPDKNWPYPDGMISASNGKADDVQIAVEYKRPNEQVHGVLTALGQALAYLSKGYQGAAIVIPDKYQTCSDPAKQLISFIDSTNSDLPIGVYTYNSSLIASGSASFKGNLKEIRPLTFQSPNISKLASASKDSTLWVHFREGSSEFDDVYKYCYSVKQFDGSKSEDLSSYTIPAKLKTVLNRKKLNPYTYLSFSVDDSKAKNRIWRAYWFGYMATADVLRIYKKKNNKYVVNEGKCKVLTPNKKKRVFFGQLKKSLVEKLNKGLISEDEAWEFFAKKVSDRAHSYREDVERFTYGIGFVDDDFRLTTLGYKYVNSCKKGNPFDDIPKTIFASACLNNGNMNLFLRFLNSVSEEHFSKKNLCWTKAEKDKHGNISGYSFVDSDYRSDIEKEFIKLHLIKKSSRRSGKKRPELQSEIALLKMIGITDAKFRVGIGLPIDWGKVQAVNDFYDNNRFNELEQSMI